MCNVRYFRTIQDGRVILIYKKLYCVVAGGCYASLLSRLLIRAMEGLKIPRVNFPGHPYMEFY